MILYDHPRSGNCHKVRLMLSICGLPYAVRFVDVPAGVNREGWFTEINPLQQIPVLVDGNETIQDSQAILVYLARHYNPAWFPDSPVAAARVMEWLSFAAKEIAVSLQVARLYYILGEAADIEAVTAASLRVLDILEQRLQKSAFLAGDQPTIADLACFPYVALSREAMIDLSGHPSVARWVERIVSMPGYIPMPGLPEPAVSGKPG